METYDARRRVGASPGNLLKTNFDLEGFKLTNFEFRGLLEATADDVFRDVCRFLGCFEYDDIAAHDLPNLVVSIRRTGLMKQLFFSDLWQAKPAYVVSMKKRCRWSTSSSIWKKKKECTEPLVA